MAKNGKSEQRDQILWIMSIGLFLTGYFVGENQFMPAMATFLLTYAGTKIKISLG